MLPFFSSSFLKKRGDYKIIFFNYIPLFFTNITVYTTTTSYP